MRFHKKEPSMQELKNLASFRRYLWKEPNLLVVTGESASLVEGARAYNTRHGIEFPPQHQSATLTRLLGATGLAAVSLAERESWGWSVALPGLDTGFFVGVEPEGMICCALRETSPNRQNAVIQRHKPQENQTESHIVPPDGDPVHLVEHYFQNALQTPTRIALDDTSRAVLVQSMPDGRFDEVATLKEPKLTDLVTGLASSGALTPMGEVLLFYECRCHDETVLKMIANLPKQTQQDLWGDKDELEIECPRCARTFLIQKKPHGKKA